MVIGHVNAETARFFSNQYDSVSTQRDAFRTIKRFTGHKSRPKMSGAVFTSDAKTDMVSGSVGIATALGERFASNHCLTINRPSPHDNAAIGAANHYRSLPIRIPFSPLISPDIPTDVALRDVNRRLPHEQRGLLVSVESIARVIQSRPAKSSCGPDGVPYTLLKLLTPPTISLLTIFFNHLIANSYFPRIWRHALVTSIPKPGKDHTIITGWRPISQLNCLSKCFERLLADKISAMNFDDLFPDQFGFLSGHSTEHAIARLQSDVVEGLNNGMVTTLVSLDLRAAFDTIWHDGLTLKLSRLGMNPFMIKIIQSMLSDRTFAVRLGDTTTRHFQMGAGVAQGSVLGPICFNFYLSDIPRSDGISNLQFADDTTAYKTHADPGAAQNDMNRHLVRLGQFFADSKLELNADKTELIHIMGLVRDTSPKLRRRVRAMRISVGGGVIPHKSDIRLLGVQLQTNARFTKHVEIRLKKAGRARFHIGRLIRNMYIPPRIKTSLYKSYIRPILTYASPTWCRPPAVSSHQMEKFRLFERGCLRSAANVHRRVGSYRYARDGDLYRLAGCQRIDRFVAQRHLRFYNGLASATVDKFRRIAEQGSPGIYPQINHLHKLHADGGLGLDDRMLVFNQRYDGSGLVYNTDQ